MGREQVTQEEELTFSTNPTKSEVIHAKAQAVLQKYEANKEKVDKHFGIMRIASHRKEGPKICNILNRELFSLS